MATASFQADLRDYLFRSNPIPMFLYDGNTLRILGANDAAAARYGYTRKEFRAMSIRDLRPVDSALHLDSEIPSRSLCTHCTKEGQPFAVEVRIRPFLCLRRKLYLMTAVDASAWSEMQLKFVRSEEIHRSLVDQCPFGIYRLNLTTSRFEQANPVLLRALGYSFEELCSIDIPDLYAEPADRNRLLSELHNTGNVRDFETRFRKKDGGSVRVSLSGYPCTDADEGHEYIQGYVLDLTRQRELEEQLSHAHRMETVGRLAGGVAHDFNNITQSISLACELAMQDELAPTVQSKFLEVMQQTSRAAEITRQLLAFSRLQVLQPRVVNVNECVRKALPMLTRAVGVDVSIELNLDETTGHVFIDPDQLALVLMQLADNARNAMPQGGVLRVSTSISPGDSLLLEPCAVLTVSDTGIGMDEQTLQRIFEPFFSTRETTLASGLGLSTVHGIIAQSKGRIECTSSIGKGAAFHIYLPVAAARSTAVAKLKSNHVACRVLLAEDDPIVNKHLSHAILKAGFPVDAVSNGEEALAAFTRIQYRLLVTDIVMPRLGGIDLTKRLRDQFPGLPVVLISGYSEEMSVLEHLPLDNTCYLQKPFAVSKLISTMHTLLSLCQVKDTVMIGAASSSRPAELADADP
jgi:PAS domain S-box-containing protein